MTQFSAHVTGNVSNIDNMQKMFHTGSKKRVCNVLSTLFLSILARAIPSPVTYPWISGSPLTSKPPSFPWKENGFTADGLVCPSGAILFVFSGVNIPLLSYFRLSYKTKVIRGIVVDFYKNTI